MRLLGLLAAAGLVWSVPVSAGFDEELFETWVNARVGDAVVFTAPVYLDFPIPGTEARYQAFENYDFFIHADASLPNQLSWLRYGACPRWSGGQPCIMHLVTWRVDSFDDVPASLREWIEEEAPLWQQPPADLDEIRALQQTN